ncbi:hypothetical protein BGY98DRAFT_1178611 [Russula aff. rugulosa BPL654]|nr:hypothetical protein BGY98DRAFT_1178611 [Russula aff. rugulosa BPL654]
MAATTDLLSVLQIIADVKTNQQDCVQLAQRAARLLMDLGRRMEESGKMHHSRCWRTSVSWRRRANEMDQRLVAKTSIQEALMRFDQQLKDAAILSRNTPRITDGQTFTSPTQSTEALAEPHVPTEEEMSPVRRHRVIVRKANCKAVGWFSGTSEAHTGGQKMTIKRVMRLRHSQRWYLSWHFHHRNLNAAPEIQAAQESLAMSASATAQDNPLTLRALLAHCIKESRHDQTWHARAPVGTLAAGDYGYIPEGSTDFANFVRLGNIQDGPGEDGKAKGMMEVVGKTHGTMLLRSSSHGTGSIPQRQPANAFLLPDELECWPVALPPRGNATAFVHHEAGLTSVNDAWQFLIACGASLASTHGIQRKAVVDMFIHEWQRETLQAGRTRRHNKPSTDAPCGLALNARLFARRARQARG